VLRTIDIAHPPLSSAEAERLLDGEIRSLRGGRSGGLLKIIHGYGSATGRSTLKETVKNWIFMNRRYIKTAVPGEEYDITNRKTQEIRKEFGQFGDPDLGRQNPGITLIWVK
jgi:hypothetical protein